MEKMTGKISRKKKMVMPQSYFRPITQDFEEESCQFCSYSDQDIDTFPCARCHTRH